MIEREDIVAAVLGAAGGRLTSSVRLQKTVYLLDRLGLNSRFGYWYRHGLYSVDLDNAIADAKAFNLVQESFDRRQSDGARYSIFTLNGEAKEEAYGDLDRDRARELIARFTETNITVLELAATVDWLWREEKASDWRREITKRKSVKVQGGRLEKAIALLEEIGLPPPEPVAAA